MDRSALAAAHSRVPPNRAESTGTEISGIRADESDTLVLAAACCAEPKCPSELCWRVAFPVSKRNRDLLALKINYKTTESL